MVPVLSLRHELARKAIHVSSAVLPLGYAAGVPRVALLMLLAALLAAALAVEIARARHERARALFTRATGVLLRAHEHGGLAGATWMLVAFLGAVLLLPRDVAIAAMLAVSLGDAAGAVIGRWWGVRQAARRAIRDGERSAMRGAAFGAGAPPRLHDDAGGATERHPIAAPGSEVAPAIAPEVVADIAPSASGGKTVVGSLACALVAAAAALLVARLAPVESLLAGLLAAAAERPRSALDDNLRIVVAVGAGILLWRIAFS